MTREIWFRGKRTDDGKWVYGDLQHDYNGEPRCISDYCGANAVIPETVGQYTGIKDRNGKEIFEGDIVEVKYEGQNLGVTGKGEVVFAEGLFGVFWGWHKDLTPLNGFIRYKHAFEVVGNKHENVDSNGERKK